MSKFRKSGFSNQLFSLGKTTLPPAKCNFHSLSGTLGDGTVRIRTAVLKLNILRLETNETLI